MKNSTMIAVLALAFAVMAQASETDTPGAAQVPNNSAMFSIVVNPEPTHVGDGGPFDWVVAVVPTASMPSGHLSVTAILAGGIRLSLLEQEVPGGHVEYAYYPVDGPTKGGHYVLESFFYGVPSRNGLSLANGKLPVGVTIEATMTPELKYLADFKAVTVRTTSVITGTEQSPDRSTVTLSGTFNPAAPAYIYFTREAVPVRPEAVTVLSDRIVIDLTKDPDTAHWSSDTYSVVVYQPATSTASALDDTATIAFQSFFGIARSQLGQERTPEGRQHSSNRR